MLGCVRSIVPVWNWNVYKLEPRWRKSNRSIVPVWNWNAVSSDGELISEIVQSYQFGIEIRTYNTDSANGRTFNRTSLELKLTQLLACNLLGHTFNRTSLELKSTHRPLYRQLPNPFNRTSLELKYLYWGMYLALKLDVQSYQFGIEINPSVGAVCVICPVQSYQFGIEIGLWNPNHGHAALVQSYQFGIEILQSQQLHPILFSRSIVPVWNWNKEIAWPHCKKY